jgi:phosphoglycolate phosphatase-like HAD superfamily hydrolase
LILAKDLHFKNIIFDLDGTLIDSAESILESLRNAFLEGNCISKLIDCCRNIMKNLKSEKQIIT